MKLKSLLLGASALCVGAMQAQITSAIMPTAGQSLTLSANSSQTAINPGPAGTGQTWNFASLLTPVSYTSTFYAANANPTGMSCTGTTLAEADIQNGSPVASTNLAVNGNGYQVTCVNVPSQQLEYDYSDPVKMLSFPLALGDSVYDTFSGTGDYAGTVLITNGYSYFVADGTGTLVLSDGTYTNTLRVRRHTVQYVIMTDPDFGDDTLNVTTGDFYEWYRPGDKLTLFIIKTQVQYVPLAQQSSTSISYSKQNGLNGISETLLGGPIELYPNPTNGNANLAITLKQTADVSYHVIDATGREVLAYNEPNVTPGAHSFTMALGGLSSGLYVVRYGVNGQYSSSKLYVQ